MERDDLLNNSSQGLFHHACIQDENKVLKVPRHLSLSSEILTVKNYDEISALIEALHEGSVKSAMMLLEYVDVGDIFSQDRWTAAHYAAKFGDADVLEAASRYSSFLKGMKTINGKTIEMAIIEAGTWCGKVKELRIKHNSII